MLREKIVIGMAMTCLLGLGSGQAQAEERQCDQMLETVCNDCHSTEQACGKIGGPERKWVARVNMMIINGADVEGSEKAMMVDCMTEPFEEAKTVCWK